MSYEVNFSVQDQQNINLFSSLLSKKKETDDDIAQLNNLEDAETDLALLDETEHPKVPFKIGGMFAMVSEPDAQTLIDNEKELVSKAIKSKDEQAKEYDAKMANLKKILYERLGDTINLD